MPDKRGILKIFNKKQNWLNLVTVSGATVLSGLAYSYARYIEPYWLDETYHKVDLRWHNPGWRGYQIAFLTDLHMGSRSEPLRTLRMAVERTLELRPDLVVLGGDYFTKGVWNPAISKLLCPLTEAGLLVVAVMGNHDYFGRRRDPERIMDNMRRCGVKVLRNQALPVSYNGEHSYIIGVDDHDRGEPDLTEATKALPPDEKPLMVIAHNPEYVPELPQNFTELVLSGHTHGGQVNPALPPFQDRLNWIRYTYTSHRTRYPLGWYAVNHNRLYVSRGLGMSGFRLRFNARPELAIFEFK
jgi:predicted MPP superfamily phosphohydrolase